LRMNLLASIVLYMAATFNYYMLTFYLKYFPGNIFENAAIYAISDLAAFMISGLVLKFLSIANSFRVAMTTAFIGGMLYLCTSDNPKLIPIFICLARVG
jgi:cell shape-determining protein MreD